MNFQKSILENPWLVFLLILVILLLFPTNNSSLDAYYYAASVKYSQDLFLPHHLLNNTIVYLFYYPFKTFSIDVLWFSKIINAAFSVLNLYICYSIFSLLNLVKKEKLIYTIIIVFSFSIWRYSMENEAYIIPITFSLLGSFHYLKYQKNNHLKHLLYSGLFAAVACLFHQIHFFWWLGLLVGVIINKRGFKTITTYSISALLIPIAYILVLIYYQNQELTSTNLIHFVFHDFYSGSAKTEFGWKNFFFIIVNSIRTFFQVHPNIYILIKKCLLYAIPILLIVYFIFYLIKAFIKKNLLTIRKIENSNFIKTHFIILILQIMFAFYAVGNVEFMVMIPFVLVFGVIIKYKINYRVLSLFAITLFIWNFSYGIFPNNNFKYYNDDLLVDFIIEHPNDIFIVKNSDILNMFYYKTGIDNYNNIILSKKIKTELQLEEIFKKNQTIYTDVINKPTIFNRGKIISLEVYKLNFEKYNQEIVYSYHGLYGTSKVYKLSEK